MDGPHVCQRCSTTFVLASSLRTHAAHIHGEGLQDFLADSSCPPSGESGYHGDITGSIKLDTVKRELCEVDSSQLNTLVTDTQKEIVGDVRNKYCSDKKVIKSFDSNDNTARDIKPAKIQSKFEVKSVHVTDTQARGVRNRYCSGKNVIKSGTHDDTAMKSNSCQSKAEVCDCEVKRIHPGMHVADKQAEVVSEAHGNDEINMSGDHNDTAKEIKPVCIQSKREVCDCEVDSVQPYTLITDAQTKVAGDVRNIYCSGKNANNNFDAYEVTARDIKPIIISSKTEVCDCEMDSVQPGMSVTDTQEQDDSDVRGISVSNSSCNHSNTVRDIKRNMIKSKTKVCGFEIKSKQPNCLVADTQEEVVSDCKHATHCSGISVIRSGTHDDTARDIKPNNVERKTEVCDCEVDGGQSSISVTDTQTQGVGNVQGNNVINKSFTHNIADKDIKPKNILCKTEVFDCEVKSKYPFTSATNIHAGVGGDNGIKSGNHDLDDTACATKINMTKTEVCDCEVDSVQPSMKHASPQLVSKLRYLLCSDMNGVKSGTHDNTVTDIKPNTINSKTEVCDCEVDTVQPSVKDTSPQLVSKLRYLLCSDMNGVKSGTHDNTVTDIKPNTINSKTEVCDCEVDTVQPSVKDTSPQLVSKLRYLLCSDMTVIKSGTHDNTVTDIKSDTIDSKTELCDCEVDSVQPGISVTDTQAVQSNIASPVEDRRLIKENTVNMSNDSDRQEQIQSEDRHYVCRLCKMTFTSLSSLKAHEHIHTSKKTYDCSICKKSFAYSCKLKRHINGVHNSVRPYLCKVSGKKFPHFQKLKRHEQAHLENYDCNFCKKTLRFKSFRSLRKHEEICIGARPYLCKFCGKTFKTLTCSQKHELLHTGDRANACEVSEKTFIRSSVTESNSLGPVEDIAHSSVTESNSPGPVKDKAHSSVTESNSEGPVEDRAHSSVTESNSEGPVEDKAHSSVTESNSAGPVEDIDHSSVTESNSPGPVEDRPPITENTVNMSNDSDRQEQIQSEDRHYVCRLCNMTFTSLISLKAHEHTHTSKKTYDCSICKKSFAVSFNLKRHVNCVHNLVRPFLCKYCGKTFPRLERLREHELAHLKRSGPVEDRAHSSVTESNSAGPVGDRAHSSVTESNSPGPVEDRAQSSVTESNSAGPIEDRAHSSMTESNSPGPVEDRPPITENTVNMSNDSDRQEPIQEEDRRYVCRLCKMTFTSLSSLKAHEHIHISKKTYDCSICKKSFPDSWKFKRHVDGVHNSVRSYPCKVCGKTFPSLERLRGHEQAHLENYDCNFCKKTLRFKSFRSLREHKEICGGARPSLCKFCGKTFKTWKCLKQHERTHTSEYPKVRTFTCKVCEKTFSYSRSLKSHERVHTGEKPYVCEICGKTYTSAKQLKIHGLSHTGERPFACTVCQKTFNQAMCLKRHMRTHTGERPYACKVCQKTFSYHDHIKKHERIHIRETERPYTCKKCKLTFSSISKFKIHERIHNIASPFSCTVCQSIFSCSSNLKKHERIHTGDKPYACKVCQKTFGCSSNLKKHESSHRDQ